MFESCWFKWNIYYVEANIHRAHPQPSPSWGGLSLRFELVLYAAMSSMKYHHNHHYKPLYRGHKNNISYYVMKIIIYT